MTRAAIYSRVSTYDKDGESIASQNEMCRAYADENGYSVVAAFEDHNVSGADMLAPDLERALHQARQGAFDVLVTRELDRFARTLVKQLIKEHEFAEAGVDVLYVLENYDDSLEGQLIKSVRGIIAEFERGKIAERMARGRLRSVKRGNVMLAQNPPLGYQMVKSLGPTGLERRRLEVVDDEAEIVRSIFAWYAYGDGEQGPMSDYKIAKRLTEMRVLTKWDRDGRGDRRKHRAGRWSVSSVQRILTSRTYIGEWVFTEDGAGIAVPVPAIIDAGLFDRVQRRRRTARIRSKRNTKHDYLFRGRALCASCGYRMRAKTLITDGIKYQYYACPGSGNTRYDIAHRCKNGSYRVDVVDPTVWRELKAILTDEARLSAALDEINDESTLTYLTEQMELAERRIKEIDASLYQMYRDAYVSGQHSQRAMQRLQRDLEADAERWHDKRASLQRQIENTAERMLRTDNLKALVADVSAGLATADKSFKRRRILVEVLDVVLRLENDGGKCAHIELDGEHIATVDLPAPKRRDFSQQ